MEEETGSTAVAGQEEMATSTDQHNNNKNNNNDLNIQLLEIKEHDDDDDKGNDDNNENNDKNDENDDYDDSEDDDIHIREELSSFQQIKMVLRYKQYTAILPMVCMYIAVGYMPTVFMSAYGAEWFSIHNDNGPETAYNYTKWTFYSSLFLSLRGVVAFLFAGFIGRLSDRYGRKKFFYLALITNSLPIIPLIFFKNIWPYFAFYIFGGLNGSNNSATPAAIAYVSDIIPSTQRTVAYGLMYLMGGIGLFIGASLAIIISIIWNDDANFIVIMIIYLCLTIYVYFFIKESLSDNNRVHNHNNNKWWFNPFSPLLHIRDHPIVYKCCIISFLISLPEVGVIDTAIPYMLDQLEINDDKTKANVITGIFVSITGLGMILTNALLLPLLKKKYTDYEISVIGSGLVTISMFLVATISWFPSIPLVCVTAFTLSLSFIVFPAIYSISTKYLKSKEQGLGMGIIFACKGLTFAISPFTFGYSYAAFKSINFPSAPYLIATFISSIAIFVIIFKLKSAIDIVKLSPNDFCLSMEGLSDTDKKEMLKRTISDKQQQQLHDDNL